MNLFNIHVCVPFTAVHWVHCLVKDFHLGDIVAYPYDPCAVSCMDLFVEISCVDRFDEKNMSAELEAEPLSE